MKINKSILRKELGNLIHKRKINGLSKEENEKLRLLSLQLFSKG